MLPAPHLMAWLPRLRAALQGIIVGRPRDGNDRVSWLSDRGRLAEALSVAEEDSSGKYRLGRADGAGRCRAVQGGQSIRQASAAANHGSWDGRTLSSNIFLRCLPACPPAVQEAVREAVGERYLQALVEAGSFPEAAALCPRVLKVSCHAYRACRALQEAAHLQRGSPRY